MLALTSIVAALGCSGTDTLAPAGPGGTDSSGGSTGTAGSNPGASTGGKLNTGGAQSNTGGATLVVSLTGGAPGAGGQVPATGGNAPIGGSIGTGGVISSTGGAKTGGAPATGGKSATGGGIAMATGGTLSTGGAATGGKSSTGGAATGGLPATGGKAATGGANATGGAAPTGGATATGGGSSCAFPTTFKWKDFGGPLAQPASGWVSLKDFTNVVYNGQHIVYMSNHDTGTSYGSAMMSPFTDWASAATATQTKLSTSTVAPELIYFAPKSTWILSYQWCSAKFCYATSTNPTSATSWAYGKTLLTENVTGSSSTGPIDQVLICDSTNCYIFYAGDNGNIYRASMPIANFPGTFSGSTTILTDTQANLFEAVEVYTVKGTGKYLMIVEAMGSGGRYFRAFSATSLGGTWTVISGAGTEASPFAGKNNVTFTGTAWTNDISHGDLVRTHDETRTVDPCNMQLLYQGKNPSSTASYDLLPYRPGLLTKI